MKRKLLLNILVFLILFIPRLLEVFISLAWKLFGGDSDLLDVAAGGNLERRSSVADVLKEFK